MQVIGVQLDIAWEDPAANREKVRSLLAAAPPQPGALVVLPEMFATGFSMNADRVAEAEAGATETIVADLARHHRATIVAGLPVRGRNGNERPTNQAVVFNDRGDVIVRYRKLHPFALGQEDRHYAAGDDVTSFAWGGLNVAPFVCYDLRFPEIFRRATTRREAELLIVIASWPVARGAHWSTLLRARAIENQAFVVGVNRCGRDPAFEYPGLTAIIDPSGTALAEAGHLEQLVAADVDVEALRTYRAKLPFLADVRAEFLGQ
jgi:omega-amidase